MAYLDRTIVLRGDDLETRPRLQPLTLAPGTVVIGVARIESESPALSIAQRRDTGAALAGMADRPPGVDAWLQTRAKVPGASPIRDVQVFRPFGQYQYFHNCLADAFTNAARTLEERLKQ